MTHVNGIPVPGLIRHPECIKRTTRIPPIYRDGLYPMNWEDESSGYLPSQVAQFYGWCLGDHNPTPHDVPIIIDYLIHVICAPCWNVIAREYIERGDINYANTLIQLRLDITEGRVTTCDHISAWLERCMEFGIDPL